MNKVMEGPVLSLGSVTFNQWVAKEIIYSVSSFVQ